MSIIIELPALMETFCNDRVGQLFMAGKLVEIFLSDALAYKAEFVYYM